MLRTSLANLRAHRARMFLSSITVLLGVGFVAGTLILGDTIKSSFFTSFARRAQHVDAAITPSGGVQAVRDRGTADSKALDPASLDAVRSLPGVAAAEGRVFGQAPLIGKDGKAVTNNGQIGFAVNIPADPQLTLFDMTSGRAPASPTEAAVDKATAESQHFALGDSVTVLDHNDVRHTFAVVGVFDVGTDKTYADQSVVALQTRTAFDLTGRPGYDEIDVRAGPGVSQTQLTADLARLPAVSGPGYHVITGAVLAKQLADSVVQFTDQFTEILLVFAFISVLVSALVIQNTFSILVAQRARELALLRCVGATRRQVFGGTIVEAAIFGLLASVGGFFAGIGLSIGMGAVLRGFGAPIPSGGLVITTQTAVIAIGLGLVLTVGSSLLPARAATRVAPVQALSAQQGETRLTAKKGRIRTALGLLLAFGGIGIGYAGMQSTDSQQGFLTISIGGAVTFLGVLALGPVIAAPIVRTLGWLPGKLFGPTARLASANAGRNPRRVATTTAALTIGITLVTMFTVVTSSIKASAGGAIAKHYPFDLQVTVTDQRSVPQAKIDALRALPQLDVVAPEYFGKGTVNGQRELLGATDSNAYGTIVKPIMVSGSMTDLVPGTVAVQDNQLAGLNTAFGQTVSVQTNSGAVRQMKVVAVYKDSGIGMPEVTVTSQDFVNDLGGTGPVGAATVTITKKAGVAQGDARTAVESIVADDPLLTVGSVGDFKKSLSSQLDQVLALFSAMLGLAILIALIGIANTLSLSVIERTRESALLRALGLTRGQLRRMLLTESVLMALLGVGMGVTLGGSFGAAIVHMFAKQSSEATMSVPFVQLGLYLMAGALAGVLAAVIPARRAARTTVTAAITDV